jgi:hypothetical protein
VILASRPGIALAIVAAAGLLLLRNSKYLPMVALAAFVCLNLFLGWKFRVATDSTDQETATTLGRLTDPSEIIVSTGNSVPQQWYYSGRTIVPNSVEVGAQLEGWADLFATGQGIEGLAAFVRLHQPIHLYLAQYAYYPPDMVLEWLNSKCVYSQVTSQLIYVERCDE